MLSRLGCVCPISEALPRVPMTRFLLQKEILQVGVMFNDIGKNNNSFREPCFVTERIPATLIVTREKSVTVSVELLPNSK